MKKTKVKRQVKSESDKLERLRQMAARSGLLTGIDTTYEEDMAFNELLEECRQEGLIRINLGMFEDEDDCPLCMAEKRVEVYEKLSMH